jgi:hypothetical protein
MNEERSTLKLFSVILPKFITFSWEKGKVLGQVARRKENFYFSQ